MNAKDLWIKAPELKGVVLTDAEKWELVRAYAIRLLSESAWTQLPDNNLSIEEQAEWDIYRETLKNIQFSYSIPDDVVFPITPTVSNLPLTIEQLEARERRKQAIIIAQSIPQWATWTQDEALTWATDNIATPLLNARTNLPTTLTLATARLAFIALLNILDKMWALQKANMQMTLALRDKNFPNLLKS